MPSQSGHADAQLSRKPNTYAQAISCSLKEENKPPPDEETGHTLRNRRIGSKTAPMLNFAGLATEINWAARSHQTCFDNYHNCGLQKHWARACLLKYDVTESAAKNDGRSRMLSHKTQSLRHICQRRARGRVKNNVDDGGEICPRRKLSPQRVENVNVTRSHALALSA